MIKGIINWEEKTVLNLYLPNMITLKYVKQTSVELKGKISKFMFVVDF